MTTADNTAQAGLLSLEKTTDSTLVIKLLGKWRLNQNLPAAGLISPELSSRPPPRRVVFDAAQLGGWDSGLVAFLEGVSGLCRARGIAADRSGLPPGVQRLLALAEAVPEKQGARLAEARPPFFERVGDAAIDYGRATGEVMAFVGGVAMTTANLARGKARFRRIDLLENVENCGARAVGIVTLISFLVGVILAVMGAV